MSYLLLPTASFDEIDLGLTSDLGCRHNLTGNDDCATEMEGASVA